MFCKFGKISEHFEWCEEQIIDWKLLPRNVMGFAEENVLPEHQWNSPRLGSAPQASCNQHRAQCRYQLATPFMVAEASLKSCSKTKITPLLILGWNLISKPNWFLQTVSLAGCSSLAIESFQLWVHGLLLCDKHHAAHLFHVALAKPHQDKFWQKQCEAKINISKRNNSKQKCRT